MPLVFGIALLGRASFAPWVRYPVLAVLVTGVLVALGAIGEAVRRPPTPRPDGFIRKGRIGPRAA